MRILTNARPVAVHGDGSPGAAKEVEFARTYEAADESGLTDSGETFRIPADQVYRAIGQRLQNVDEALAVENGKIVVDEHGRTSLDRVWAGGDCASRGEDLTVTAVAQGRDAAEDIHRVLVD